MTNSGNIDSRGAHVEASTDLNRLKSEAEIDKLRLEAEELRERINKAQKWYTGRYLVEALIGGVVAGALFMSWFVGFYSPSISIEKERLEFAKEREKEKYDRVLEHLQSENEEFLRKHQQFSELMTDSNKRLHKWAKEVKTRLKVQTDAYNEKESDYSYQELQSFFTYLAKESDTLENVIEMLEIDVSRGNDQARQFRDAVDKLDNTDFTITIVYDHGFEKLAYQARDILMKHQYSVGKVEKWIWFRADDDGSMSSYFKDGPVLWYDKKHQRTSEKIKSIKRGLTEVFPENMTVQSGDTIVVPGTTWLTPQANHVQLWLFQKR